MTDDEITTEAKDRFELAAKWEAEAHQRFIADTKFTYGDDDNGWQWHGKMSADRERDGRPHLTINKVRQHVLQIVNDARQNKVSIKVAPTGDQATYGAAQVLEDLVRHIEYQSVAQDAYITGCESQVIGGWGYWRVVCDYADNESLDQEIFIRRIKDPLTVYLDPDIKEKDGSDAKFAFVFDYLPKESFEKKYPKFKDKVPTSPLGASQEGWSDDDHVRVAEYFRCADKKDRLYVLADGTMVKRSKLLPELAKELDADESVKSRDIIDNEITWYLIVGETVVEKRKWPGKYIPIVRVIGEEIVVSGQLHRFGHVRMLRDPQRMYNYWASGAAEFVALQSKSPYVIASESVEGVETYWETANTENHAYLPYKGLSDSGMQLPPPQRAQPPQPPAAFLTGMAQSAQEMMMVSGQYQSQMGEQSNERTGVAIQERQRQGDNATYHYIDNLATAIRYTGRILIDLIPHIYDSERVIHVMQENGQPKTVHINPDLPQAHTQQQTPEGEAKTVLNPSVGRYEVQSDVGPQFATRRQEAFNALTQLAASAPIIMEAAPDLVMRAADFPMAEELAERLRNMVPPQAFGKSDPQFLKLQEQLQQQTKVIESLTQKLSDEAALGRERSQQKDIDVYKAETDRMKALAVTDPTAMLPLIQQLIQQALAVHLGPVLAASNPQLQPAIAPPSPAGTTGQMPIQGLPQ